MRLLHTIHSLSAEGGGPAEALMRLTESAHALQVFESEVVSLDSPSQPYLRTDRVPVHVLGPAFGKYGFTSRLYPWLIENLPRFEGVVVHGLWQYESLAVWRACHHRLPYVVFPHGMLDPWFGRAYPLKHLKKVLYWHALQHRILRDAAAVLFTASLEAELAATAFQPNEWTSVVVPFGTAAPAGDRSRQIEEFEAACPGVRGRAFVLFLGRLHPKKGCDLLIEAVARYSGTFPATHLVMAGPDELGYRAKLAALAEGLGVGDRVQFPGMLRGDAKWGAFYAAEVFALPSHQENFGIAVAEALACGTPVLISNKVNIWREIAEDEVGLIDEDNIEGTLRLLQRWSSLPTVEKAAMAARCRTTFERRFNIARLPEAIARLFAKQPRPSPGS